MLVSFLAGFLASFSPCIYPLIPITLGIVGSASEASRSKGFLLSSVFVLGICTIYSILGVISAFFGLLLGTFFINPITTFILAIIFIVLGLSFMGVINLKIPFLSFAHQPDPKKGLLSLFALGIVSGFAMIPCNFPVLFSILNLISSKKNVIYAAVALFIFSLGYGLILIILGTFSSLIRKLPKQGKWLIIIKCFLGLIIIGVGIWYLKQFFALLS